jgi:tRNA A37 methylthiotransferase MiaB
MNSKKNFYLVSKESFNSRVIPVLWSSAKTFYEQNGVRKNEWNWNDPWLTYDHSPEQIIEICKISPPSIFGFSVYVWNEKYMDNLAQLVKQEFPDCLIVYGGPQVDIKYSENFFKIKYWVDIVCASDGYGEITIKELLDNYPIQNFEDVPYIYYTNDKKEKFFTKKTIDKKTFVWPDNIYSTQEKNFMHKVHEVEYAMVETTRGCPYKCIYCDWGGGTYTKIVSKPYTTILDEIEWAAKHKIHTIELASANFGILPIDVEIANYVVEMKEKYGYPKFVYTENAKNSLDRVAKIKQVWAKHGLINHYKVSIQTLNNEIKNNIERIDPDIEKQIEVVKLLKETKKDLPIKVETIIGLPGDSYQNNLDQIDAIFQYDLPLPRSNIWMLLPEAPAFSPEMRVRFKIKTVKKMFVTFPWATKPSFVVESGVLINSFPQNENVESVVGTYSYTTQDFVDMFMINAFAQSGDSSGLNKYLIPYITKNHNVNPSFIFDDIYKTYFRYNNWSNKNFGNQICSVFETMNKWVHDDLIDVGFDYHKNFPLILPIHMYLPFLILTNLTEFYKEICEHLANKFNDTKIIDLGNFLSNSIIDFSYNPDSGRIFSTQYNWQLYFETNNLQDGNYVFEVNDQTIYTNGSYLDIDWHKISDDDLQKKKQFVYKQLGDITLDKLSKTIKIIN